MAKALNMSEKTLQRCLAKEGTSFSKELASLRQQKSVSLFSETDLSVTEVAFYVATLKLAHFIASMACHQNPTSKKWQ